MELGEYLTEQNLRLVLMGTGAGALSAGLRVLSRRTPGWLVGAFAPVIGLFVAGWLVWPDVATERMAAAAVVGLTAGLGFRRLQSFSSALVPGVVLLACAGGVWLAIPENGPVLVVAGVLLGVGVVGGLMDRGVGWGLASAVAWTVVLGARPTGWSFVGGLLCLAPLVALGVRPLVPFRRRRVIGWPWFVVGSGAVSFAAARWVGVAPDATVARVVVVAAGAGVLAVLVRD